MANTLPNLIITISLIFFSLSTLVATAQDYSRYSRTLSKEDLGLNPEKFTHLHFYFHDTTEGKNPTVLTVAGAPNATRNTTTFFGDVVAMDDPLTVGPEISSKLIGRAQGIYTYTSQSEISMLVINNYIFLDGIYNGSTISVLGRNAIYTGVREMPIIGGTGVFRFARGYVQAKTYKFEPKISLDAIVEYDAYIFHY